MMHGGQGEQELWAALADGKPVTDVHINSRLLEGSVLYPGPRRAAASARLALASMLAACESVRKDEFMIEAVGRCWRGRRDSLAVDGTWYRCRLIPPIAPTLETLPTPLPSIVTDVLLTPSLIGGGLIYVVGAAGSGKTTTASAVVTSRLHRFAGCAYTVEDPPEMPLSGWHGEGFCSQAWVPGERSTDWASALRGALRSQPSNTPSMLYVGEVRESESARMMLRAASNGFLVVATGFGNDIPSGLEALAMLAGQEALSMLASTFRIGVHTRIMQKNMVVNVLTSTGGTSAVGAAIARAQFRQLAGDVNQQANLMREGVNPLKRAD